jgi:hypothetical protein
VITDPIFYLLAIPAVILLGLGKGGFAGLGMIAVPLLTLRVPILQGAAIILPLMGWTRRAPAPPSRKAGMGLRTPGASHATQDRYR